MAHLLCRSLGGGSVSCRSPCLCYRNCCRAPSGACYTGGEPADRPNIMDRIAVLHYHELWLKGRNRSFFLSRLVHAVRRVLEGLPVEGVTATADRILVQLGAEAPAAEVVARLQRVPGIANFAIARPAPRDLEAICRTAWEEIRNRDFSSFAVRARRGDKSFPLRGGEIEREVGAYLLRELAAAGRAVRVHLDAPELTCWIEILADRALVYAERHTGVHQGAVGQNFNPAGEFGGIQMNPHGPARSGQFPQQVRSHLAFDFPAAQGEGFVATPGADSEARKVAVADLLPRGAADRFQITRGRPGNGEVGDARNALEPGHHLGRRRFRTQLHQDAIGGRGDAFDRQAFEHTPDRMDEPAQEEAAVSSLEPEFVVVKNSDSIHDVRAVGRFATSIAGTAWRPAAVSVT